MNGSLSIYVLVKPDLGTIVQWSHMRDFTVLTIDNLLLLTGDFILERLYY